MLSPIRLRLPPISCCPLSARLMLPPLCLPASLQMSPVEWSDLAPLLHTTTNATVDAERAQPLATYVSWQGLVDLMGELKPCCV